MQYVMTDFAGYIYAFSFMDMSGCSDWHPCDPPIAEPIFDADDNPLFVLYNGRAVPVTKINA